MKMKMLSEKGHFKPVLCWWKRKKETSSSRAKKSFCCDYLHFINLNVVASYKWFNFLWLFYVDNRKTNLSGWKARLSTFTTDESLIPTFQHIFWFRTNFKSFPMPSSVSICTFTINKSRNFYAVHAVMYHQFWMGVFAADVTLFSVKTAFSPAC